MQMNAASIKNQKAEWEALGVKLPAFDHEAMNTMGESLMQRRRVREDGLRIVNLCLWGRK